jgi:hypothetical protein
VQRNPATNQTDEPQHDPDRKNEFRSYMALLFAAVLVIGGIWLVTAMNAKNKTIECLEAGHHDCVPLDPNDRGAPR